jgi:DNA-binding NtrC family response regulator
MDETMKKKRNVRKKSDQTIIDAVQNELYPYARSLGLKQAVRIFEAAVIASSLKESDGNLSEAARILNVPSTTLQSKRDVMDDLIVKVGKKIKKATISTVLDGE